MEQKPFHYDGSVQLNAQENGSNSQEIFEITDEMRKNIGANPYSTELND